MSYSSIRLNILKRTLIGAIAILLFFSFVGERIIMIWLQSQADKHLLIKAKFIQVKTKVLENGDIEFYRDSDYLQDFDLRNNPEYFQIWAEDGRVLARSESVKKSFGPEADLPKMPFSTVKHDFQDVDLATGNVGRLIQIVFHPKTDVVNGNPLVEASIRKKVTLVLIKERNYLNKMMLLIDAVIFGGITLIIIFIVIVTIYSVKTGLKPLDDLQEQLIRVVKKNFSGEKVLFSSSQELVVIVEELNAILDMLEKNFSREKQFSSDVAHELRTPIAEIRNMAEVALKLQESDEIHTHSKNFFREILGSSRQMQQLVNNLLALARCENGQVVLSLKKIELGKKMADVWLRFREDAEKKNLCFKLQCKSPINFVTSALEFDLILNNIFSNAIEYSPENSLIVADITEENSGVTIRVSNGAESLSARDMPYIFDRLWRKDESRSSGMHAGLGMSLIKSYAELLRLNVVAELSESRLFTIIITRKPV